MRSSQVGALRRAHADIYRQMALAPVAVGAAKDNYTTFVAAAAIASPSS